MKIGILIILALVTLTGCVTEPEVDLKTPEGLYEMGQFYQKQSRYEEAIAQYKALSSKHTYSPLAVRAELRVADCYYERDEFEEAYASYKLFHELHPTFVESDYVVAQIADSLHQQIPSSVDRDLSQVKKAINYYQELTSVYPDSKYSEKANEKKIKLAQMLADKEIYIADFYYKQEQFISALSRYELFLKDFPKNPRTPYVLLRSALSAKEIDKNDKSDYFKKRLISNFPDSKEAKTAERKL